jgi:hypothetical protein
MGHSKIRRVSRRRFLKTELGAAALGFPSIVPAKVCGQFAQSERINVGEAKGFCRVRSAPLTF